MKKKRKNKTSNKLIKVTVYLIFLLIIFNYAPNYEVDANYKKNEINLSINNENVTKYLKYNLFVNDEKQIYISIDDISNYFDKTIRYDEANDEIITTFGEKTAKLPLDENIIKMSGWNIDVISGAIKKEDIYYIPLTAMEDIYEIDIEYIQEEKILLVDLRSKKLVKADVAKKCKLKYKPTSFSKTVAKLEKADKVICIEKLENNWTKVRTKKGKIGYIKTRLLQNEIYIRDDMIV